MGFLASALGLLLLAAPPPPPRAAVDEAALREAVAGQEAQARFSSAAAYAHFLEARLALEAGAPERAAHALELALASDEGEPHLELLLAEAWARAGARQKALRLVRGLVRERPRDGGARLLLGRLALEAGWGGEAREHLLAAARLLPDAPVPVLALCQLDLASGRPEEAARRVERWGQAHPEQAGGALKRVGLALLDRGETARAVRLLARVAAPDAEVCGELARVGHAALPDTCPERALSSDRPGR